jgi:hypothetical protein
MSALEECGLRPITPDGTYFITADVRGRRADGPRAAPLAPAQPAPPTFETGARAERSVAIVGRTADAFLKRGLARRRADASAALTPSSASLLARSLSRARVPLARCQAARSPQRAATARSWCGMPPTWREAAARAAQCRSQS